MCGADWEAAWSAGVTPWDVGGGSLQLKEVRPALVPDTSLSTAPFPSYCLSQLLKEGSLPTGRALVPGAGSAYDAMSLAEAGYDVTSLDISETAVEQAKEKVKLDPAAAEAAAAGRLRLEQADFFSWAPPAGGFDVIFDYTFLCALDPARRQAWASTTKAFLARGGSLVTQLFPIGQFAGGPPFALDLEDVGRLMRGSGFECVHSADIPATLSHPARAGREVLAVWKHSSRRYPMIKAGQR